MGKLSPSLFSEIEYKISNGRMRGLDATQPKGDTGRKERGHIWRSLNGSNAAMLKRISTAGTHHPRQLAGQLAYINGKSQEVFGSSVEHDGVKAMSEKAIAALIDDWSSAWTDGKKRRTGQTSHMVMSFPKHVTERQASMIAQDWCREMFEERMITDDTWRYYAALHTDQAHPHVHIVLNNMGDHGEWFYMGRNHHFSPDKMRERIAEIAQEYGVYLDASTRLERGVVEYAPSSGEVQRAKRLGVEPVTRKREGKAMDRAIAKMAEYQAEYLEMAKVARAAKSPEMSILLEDAAARLGAGDTLQLPEQPVTSLEAAEHPIDLREALLAWVARNDEKIAELEPEQREDIASRVYGTLERIEAFMQQDFALSEQEAVVELNEPKSVMHQTAEPVDSNLPPKRKIFRTGGRFMEAVVGDFERLRDRAAEYLPDGVNVARLDRYLKSSEFRLWAANGILHEGYLAEKKAIYDAIGDFTQADFSEVPKQLQSIMNRARETGIDTKQLAGHLITGANNLQQENEWIRGDIQAVVEKRPLALNVEAHRKKAVETVQNVYNYANEVMDKLEQQQVHVDEVEFNEATREIQRQMKAYRTVRFSDAATEKNYLLAFKAKYGVKKIDALAHGDLAVLDGVADQVQAQRDIAYATLKMANKYPEAGIKSHSIDAGMEAYNPRIWHGTGGHSIGL